MAIIVYVDEVEGTRASHHIINGWKITRRATVSGLAGISDTGTMLQTAENALISVVGDRGASCPNISVPTFLQEFVPELISDQEVRFSIIYSGFMRPVFEFSSSLNQTETNLTLEGNVATVYYDFPSNYAGAPNLVGNSGPDGHGYPESPPFAKPLPQLEFTVRFVIVGGTVPDIMIGSDESGGFYNTYSFPGAQSATNVASWFTFFEGCINNEDYTLGLRTGKKHQWLISSVAGISRDGGLTYEMSMTFQLRPIVIGGVITSGNEPKGGWDTLMTFIDPLTGMPPTTEQGFQKYPGKAQKLIQVYLATTFPTFTFGPN